jgi:hypothetical protein
VGGVVEVVGRGVPAGWGDPTMDKLDAALGGGDALDPATKGIEIGGGFGMVALRGSQTNDVFDGERYTTNFSGGIAGGISNGNEVVVRVAVAARRRASASRQMMAKARRRHRDGRDRRPPRHRASARASSRSPRPMLGDHARGRLAAPESAAGEREVALGRRDCGDA